MPAVYAGLALAALLTLPGWALLAAGQQWRGWAPLQRWCLAIALSAALYPTLFYSARLVPGLTLGPYKLAALLAACALWLLWRLRGHWRAQFAFDGLEWLALGLISLTLITRFWIVRAEPYPAWTDSLHHALLTDLTALQGRLPDSLLPYFPIPLDQYHLGLYAVSGSVQMLSGAPAHLALLVTAQTFNGLCGLGVYLVLDRKVGRLGAVAGLAAVGLLARMPAWYVNWGRFTQLAGQFLMLAAWLLTWEALARWRARQPGADTRRTTAWLIVMAALMSAGMFLFHFRVALFAVPLYLGVGLWEFWQAWRAGRARPVLVAGGLVVGLTLVLIGPALLAAGTVYVAAHTGPPLATPEAAASRSSYFEYGPGSLAVLAGPGWLIVLAALAGLLGLWRRQRLALLTLAWVASLLAIGELYLLNIRLLEFTNLGAILIMLYMPTGLLLGVGAQAAADLARERGRRWAPAAVAGLVALAALVMTPIRLAAFEPSRYFVTPADVDAMRWISANTPPNALFAINTVFWLPTLPHGTDAGYWIPYFTGRQTSTGPMLATLGAPEYFQRILVLSHAVERLETDAGAVDELRRLGVDYIYIGARDDFSGLGLNAVSLAETGLQVAYQRDGVTILRMTAEGQGDGS